MKGLFPGKTVIGMTGGVGSGKSLVLTLLKEKYGACILEADRVCKTLIEKEGRAFDSIVSLLGPGILAADGSIDKAKMAGIIFRDAGKLEAVNRVLHPATFEEVCRLTEEAEETLIVYESAIPWEARFPELCDWILYVYAPRKLRLERLSASRGYSTQKSLSIMKNQPSEKEYRSLADAVLNNAGGLSDTEKRLARILKRWGLPEQT